MQKKAKNSPKSKRKVKPWSKAELKQLATLYKKMTALEVAKVMKRTPDSIKRKVRYIGIHK